MDVTKSRKSTETKLKRIAEQSAREPEAKFKWLMPHFNKESLHSCFVALNARKAVGADGRTKEDYGRDLERNLADLMDRMTRMAYKPGPVREVLIPKEGKRNAFRPLGIGNIEDKIVQSMTKKVLESIYEPIFLDCSYGFRPGRSCHDAIRALHQHLFRNDYGVSFNNKRVSSFVYLATRTFFKWINRRSQRKSMTWEQFHQFMKEFPPPQVKVYQPLY